MSSGKIIEKPEEITFVQAVAIEGSKFGLLQSEVSGVAIMWRRFKRIYYNDYFYMRTLPYFDAACFIPIKNIIFHGFGILAHYNQKDCNYIVKWIIDEDKSDEYKISRADGDKDPEHKWHTINLKEDCGAKPIKVQEG